MENYRHWGLSPTNFPCAQKQDLLYNAYCIFCIEANAHYKNVLYICVNIYACDNQVGNKSWQKPAGYKIARSAKWHVT